MSDPSPSRRKRPLLRRLLVLTLLAIGAFAGYRLLYGPEAFTRHWKNRFETVNDLGAAERLEQSDHVILQTFPSGEWLVAVCEHSCCDGAGFNRTVIRDSRETTYVDTAHCFCGMQDLRFTFEASPAESLTSFYAHLSILKLRPL